MAMESPDSLQEQSSLRNSPAPDHEEKNTYIRFLVSNAEAGSVIGKGGSAINDFQSQSGARIQLSRNYEVFPGTSDRIMTVSGNMADILKAVDLILAKLLGEFYAEDDGDANPRSKVCLIVPNSCCGGIIGKGGATIKSFIEDSQAGIKVSPQDNNYHGVSDRLVTLTGTLKEQMRAIGLILFKLADDRRYMHSTNAPFPFAAYAVNQGLNGTEGKFQNDRFHNKEDNNSSLTIGVPDEHIGIVLGRGGKNIFEITQESGARIKISEKGDFISGTSNRKVTITGSEKAICIAGALISHKIASASDRSG